ncbi:DUF1445 domain-containing protein [Robbsia sp. Bb-Pol-6]|uniref:DUF1445 domain-containing protein n=1 Tax=Robbsia betulipollinis TaxID=2981849 RepID=A0ABT3ZKU5_9BURK|nr:DUF1445 domain-containing protein [Robbsia betulipollinis]MCY0386568.1 DUF1445 domain-containing protein [Robbsia betulipollinis]
MRIGAKKTLCRIMVLWGLISMGMGIRDVMRPDEGEPTRIEPGEVPVFRACGVTPQAVAVKARPPCCITHAPGHMPIDDVRTEDRVLL